MNSICIIPARGGSKRIPRKNVAILGGKPLLYYTVLAAIQSSCFHKIVVSTDDDEICRMAMSLGAEVDIRPKEMGSDTATKDDLIHEYLTRNNVLQGVITCLLPTCPFRTEKHILEAHNRAQAEEFKLPVVSVKKYDFPIDFALSKTNEGYFKVDQKLAYTNTLSQSKATKFHPNGAIYVRSIPQFLEHKTFMTSNVIGYEMNELDSWDIDLPWQLELAQHLVKK